MNPTKQEDVKDKHAKKEAKRRKKARSGTCSWKTSKGTSNAREWLNARRMSLSLKDSNGDHFANRGKYKDAWSSSGGVHVIKHINKKERGGATLAPACHRNPRRQSSW